jgi:hypothetical protein
VSAASAVEGLEDRRMLSVSVDHRVLVIEGTRRGDTVMIDREGRKGVNVTVNGHTSSFSVKQFGKIRIVLGKGDDYVRVGSADHPLAVATLATGGDGNDTVYTGAGNDSVDGGAGADSLMSYSGSDTVRGGVGDDYINGGDDNDSVYGDDGNDTVWAGDGDDLACGNAGDDEMWDGAGTDSVYGNKGNDRYVVRESRKEFKDRADGEIYTGEPVYSSGYGSAGAGNLYVSSGYGSAGSINGAASLNANLNMSLWASNVSDVVLSGRLLTAQYAEPSSSASNSVVSVAGDGLILQTEPGVAGGTVVVSGSTLAIGTPITVAEAGWELTVPAGWTVVGPDAVTTVQEGASFTVVGGSAINGPSGATFSVAADVTVTVTGGATSLTAVTMTPPPAPVAQNEA